MPYFSANCITDIYSIFSIGKYLFYFLLQIYHFFADNGKESAYILSIYYYIYGILRQWYEWAVEDKGDDGFLFHCFLFLIYYVVWWLFSIYFRIFVAEII